MVLLEILEAPGLLSLLQLMRRYENRSTLITDTKLKVAYRRKSALRHSSSSVRGACRAFQISYSRQVGSRQSKSPAFRRFPASCVSFRDKGGIVTIKPSASQLH